VAQQGQFGYDSRSTPGLFFGLAAKLSIPLNKDCAFLDLGIW
jgi:hypothetical protein